MPKLEDYGACAGMHTIDELRHLAQRLKDKSVLYVNSTAYGGGVAEILIQMVPLLKELGVSTRWEVIKGSEEFFNVTKKFHNALHGVPADVTAKDFKVFEETTEKNLAEMDLNSDFVFMQDPQPAAMVKDRHKYKNQWIWRCHIDVSQPDQKVWGFLEPYVKEYDACVFSAPAFARKLPIPQALIPPSIDPLSDKNRDLEPSEIKKILDRLEIPTDKPLATQISRFDYLKDPMGVVDAFKGIRPYVDARLLLVGGAAADDPEGMEVYNKTLEKAKGDPNIKVILLPPGSNVEINAIQRASSVIMQKSTKEGFGLTVSEALWKGRPVIASAVGGIPLQIVHKHSGILTHSNEGVTYWLKRLLQEPGFAKTLGENGRENVRHNFLLTRHLRDYLLLFLFVEHGYSSLIRV
ncbi:glycosyltransferase [Elusimicrobiota bacterium]